MPLMDNYLLDNYGLDGPLEQGQYLSQSIYLPQTTHNLSVNQQGIMRRLATFPAGTTLISSTPDVQNVTLPYIYTPVPAIVVGFNLRSKNSNRNLITTGGSGYLCILSIIIDLKRRYFTVVYALSGSQLTAQSTAAFQVQTGSISEDMDVSTELYLEAIVSTNNSGTTQSIITKWDSHWTVSM
ncbi:hypothetical protein ACFVQB_12455 [Paenibacillus sp. NPDC057886]|uniref:hypothetical protein n=1 Tax=Paenibacillus sp. NPDC057886 TaxID=3346270 RepID=UPI0036947787